MLRKRVLVFVLADLSNQHGGNLWLQSLFYSLSRIEEFDFTIVTSGREQASTPNENVVRGFGFQHVFLPLSVPLPGLPSGLGRRLKDACLDKYFFNLERWAHSQVRVDAALSETVRGLRPDLILVSDIWSAMCCPSAFESGTPCCLITLNNEAKFHRVSRRMGGPIGRGIGRALERALYRHGNWVANVRLKQYMNELFGRCAGIVALTKNDLPASLRNEAATQILPPLLEESDLLWRYSGIHSLLFVGNVGHFPNRLAIEWLCTRLAPALYKLERDLVINVIGADRQHLGWRATNVRFLGSGTRRDVIDHMTTDSIFIAPIENAFGAKLKLVECASFGMPFVATQAAMSGLPFLECVPRFELDKPVETARMIVKVIRTPCALSEMSRRILQEMKKARIEQTVDWRSFLEKAMSMRSVDDSDEARAARFEEGRHTVSVSTPTGAQAANGKDSFDKSDTERRTELRGHASTNFTLE